MAERTRTGERETERSRELHRQALDIYPGGVSHNVRYFDPHPIYVERSEGPRVWDADGNEYVDYWNNHMSAVLGHAYPDVVEAVTDQAEKGLHYGSQTELSVEVGRKIQDFVPSAERLRFCLSGTEATMYGVRMARASTGKDHILKAEGGWHGGNTDLSWAISAPFDEPDTQGLPPGVLDHVHAYEVNDQDSVTELLEEYEVGGIIIDPRKAGTPPTHEFLEFLKDESEDRGFELIFDEVVTGMRIAPGSYQARVGITPDITTMGKFVGGGMPVGAIAGRADLFENARPDVDVPEGEALLAGGGTYTDNPMTLAAADAGLSVLRDEPVHDHIESLGERVREGFQAAFDDAGVKGQALGIGSLFISRFNADEPLESPTQVAHETDAEVTEAFHNRLVERGHYFLPGHMGSTTYAHTEEQIEDLIADAREVIVEMREDGAVEAR